MYNTPSAAATSRVSHTPFYSHHLYSSAYEFYPHPPQPRSPAALSEFSAAAAAFTQNQEDSDPGSVARPPFYSKRAPFAGFPDCSPPSRFRFSYHFLAKLQHFPSFSPKSTVIRLPDNSTSLASGVGHALLKCARTPLILWDALFSPNLAKPLNSAAPLPRDDANWSTSICRVKTAKSAMATES